MARPTIFNAVKIAECLELVKKGYNVRTIAQYMDISPQTLMNWQHKYPKFKEMVQLARIDSAKEIIEVGLRKLAAGSEDKTITHKYVGTKTVKIADPITAEMIETVVPAEIIETIKERAPDSKSIEILARKYDKEFVGELEDKGVVINLLEGFTMRDLQESRTTIDTTGETIYREDTESDD